MCGTPSTLEGERDLLAFSESEHPLFLHDQPL